MLLPLKSVIIPHSPYTFIKAQLCRNHVNSNLLRLYEATVLKNTVIQIFS